MVSDKTTADHEPPVRDNENAATGSQSEIDGNATGHGGDSTSSSGANSQPAASSSTTAELSAHAEDVRDQVQHGLPNDVHTPLRPQVGQDDALESHAGPAGDDQDDGPLVGQFADEQNLEVDVRRIRAWIWIRRLVIRN